jgi:hypothetical protein
MAPLLFSSSSFAELRAVATTVKPLASASRAMPLPKPLDAAVISQTGDIVGMRMRVVEGDQGVGFTRLGVGIIEDW